MKKRIKKAFIAAGIIAVPVVINYMITKNAEKKVGNRAKEMYYDWMYGDIRYIKKGKGEPLLLIHGIGAGNSLLEWEKCIDALSAQYRVYAIDLLGFGYSDKPAISYSSYLYVKLINDFIKEVIGESVYAVGSSNSGAFLAAAASFEPKNYKKIMLVSPTGIGSNNCCSGYKQTTLKKIMESPILGTTIFNMICSKPYMKWFLDKYCMPDCETANLHTINRYYYPAHCGGSGGKYAIAAFVSQYLSINIEQIIGRLTVPVHTIWGSDNGLNPIENYKALEKANPNIGLTIFEGTKLVPHAERPKQFYKECRTFFQ